MYDGVKASWRLFYRDQLCQYFSTLVNIYPRQIEGMVSVAEINFELKWRIAVCDVTSLVTQFVNVGLRGVKFRTRSCNHRLERGNELMFTVTQVAEQ